MNENRDSIAIAVFGSTGSIGTSTLDVVDSDRQRFVPIALSAHSRLETLRKQAELYRPRWIIATDCNQAKNFKWGELGKTEVLYGDTGLLEVAEHPDVHTIVAAIVGSAGLASTMAAVRCGKRIALANKETLVVAGPLVGREAQRSGAELLPVDSEHSAIFQACKSGRKSEIKRVILTASGGPFRQFTSEQLQEVTPEQALAHPTWDMGPKISIDSATMMNKALEIIEARWLFDIDSDLIDVVVHPQSIIHSMVEFVDGSVIAQLSPPDMRLPIQYALTYPNRSTGPATKLDLTGRMQLELEPPDLDRFPALQLGHEVARRGGTAGAVVNAANEAAVKRFLDGEIRFTEIVQACQAILEQHDFDPNPSLDELMRLDRWARRELDKWILA